MCHVQSQPGWRGFSLVELLIVLILVGTIGAIAMPRLAGATSRQQLGAAANRVEADLNRARTRARASSQTMTVVFGVAGDAYVLRYPNGDTQRISLGESPYQVDIANAKFGTTRRAVFNGYGVPDDPGFVVLRLGSEQVTITLEANGEVRR